LLAAGWLWVDRSQRGIFEPMRVEKKYFGDSETKFIVHERRNCVKPPMT
jgi:hypothetical protein